MGSTKRSSSCDSRDEQWVKDMSKGRLIFQWGSRAKVASLKNKVLRQLCREYSLEIQRPKAMMVAALIAYVR